MVVLGSNIVKVVLQQGHYEGFPYTLMAWFVRSCNVQQHSSSWFEHDMDFDLEKTTKKGDVICPAF